MAAAIPPRIQERRSYSKAAECRPCTLVVRPQAAPALQSQPGGQLRRCRVAWPSEKFERALLSSALLRIECLVILYKTSVFRIRTRRRWGIRTGMRTRARLLKQNENRRDGAATGPWSYLVVRSCGSGRASPPRSRRARCAEDAGCRQRRDR